MTSRRFNPYPGLRPFRESEAHLFFGRGEQIDELAAELARSRFVAVMGASGSGKSSLVRAGLLPTLHGGFSRHGASDWRVAIFRPGGNPIHNLARSLAPQGADGGDDADSVTATARLEAILRRSGLGLADAARGALELDGGRLLVVVDQFEELFRYQSSAAALGAGDDGAAFVRLLIEATTDNEAPIDVIVTMRSDFLGDCAQFRQLPETINDGLYLVPRLNRWQLREAMTSPAAVGGGALTFRLAQRLLNDAGGDPDILPVVQHTLMRTWDLWAANGHASGPVDMEHYVAAGGLEAALSSHADEAYYELRDDRRQAIAEVMFKRLTEVGPDGREVRRPTPLSEIAADAGAAPNEVLAVIDHFSRRDRSFLTLSADDVVDISHESLIRQWPRLRAWAQEEAQSRDVYRRLADAAGRWERGEAALLRNPDLAIASQWWTDAQPTPAWAGRYHPGFDGATAYLDRSRRAARRRRRWAAAGVAALAVVAVAMGLLAAYAGNQRSRVEAAARITASRQLAALSLEYGAEQRVLSLLAGIQAVHMTSDDELRVPAAEEALRSALQDPLGRQLPGIPGGDGVVQPVTALAFSPDDSVLVTAGDDGIAQVWDLEDPEAPPAQLRGHADGIGAAAVSPDGTLLATGSDDGDVRLWHLDDLRRPPAFLGRHQTRVAALAFSPDGSRLATASLDGTAILWNALQPESPRRTLATLLAKTDDGIETRGTHGGFSLALAFSPDGRRLVTGGGDDLARVWDVNRGILVEPLIGHTDDVVAVAFSSRGEMIATASTDHTVGLWDSGGTLVAQLHHEGPVNTIAFSVDGRWLASGSGDRTARLWDVRNPNAQPVVLHHQDVVEVVAFSASGRWLATGSRDNTARLFDLDGLDGRAAILDAIVLGGHEGPVTELAFSSDMRWLATAGRDGSTRLWDLSDLSTRPVLLSQDDAELTSAAFSPDGKRLATGTTAKTATTGTTAKTALVWDVDAPTDPLAVEHDTIEGFVRAAVTATAYSSDGRWLATGSGDGRVRLWEADDPTGSPPEELVPEGDIYGVNALAFDPAGRWLAVAVKDKVAWLWDVNDLDAEPRALSGHDLDVTSLAFSPDGRWLATGSRDTTIILWRLYDLTIEPDRLSGHDAHVTSLALSPDGRTLASGGRDGEILLWSLDSGPPAIKRKLSRDGLLAGPVASLAFSLDGSQLASAVGTTALLWDLDGPDADDPIANPVVLDDHDGAVTAVAFSPVGPWLATASEDGTARLWLLLDDLVELGCQNAGRNFTQDEWTSLLPDRDYESTCGQRPAGR